MKIDPKQEIQMLDFCQRVKAGFGNITDSNVKKEFERTFESQLETPVLAELLALLESQNLLDKKHSANKQPDFYRTMKKMM